MIDPHRDIWPAPAKINLHLFVTGRREDGRHTLDTSFIFVDCADGLTLRPAPALNVRCTLPELNGSANLVWRALEAMRGAWQVRDGMEVFIRKRLPLQAGLGGGSSDAATAMLAANALWRLHRPVDELIALAAPLGADIPCFLFGRASLARGVGDHLSPLRAGLDGHPVLLARPDAGLSTARVFAEYDRLAPRPAHGSLQLTPRNTADTIRANVAGLGAKPDSGRILGRNALEDVAVRLCPPLATLLERMRQRSSTAWMSGSGTTCVALTPDLASARELGRELQRDRLAVWTHAGRLLERHPLHAGAPGPASERRGPTGVGA